MPQVITQYVATGKVYLTYHDFAFIDSGAANGESHQAAAAARCVGDKFWPFHDYLFENQNPTGENLGRFTAAFLASVADAVGADRTAYDACMANGATAMVAAVVAETRPGQAAGVHQTPTVALNGKLLQGGALPMSTLGPGHRRADRGRHADPSAAWRRRRCPRHRPRPRPRPEVRRMARGRPALILGGLAAIGLAISLYLSANEIAGTAPVCMAGGGCETVAASQYSHWFGIPVAFFGVLFSGRSRGRWSWRGGGPVTAGCSSSRMRRVSSASCSSSTSSTWSCSSSAPSASGAWRTAQRLCSAG